LTDGTKTSPSMSIDVSRILRDLAEAFGPIVAAPSEHLNVGGMETDLHR